MSKWHYLRVSTKIQKLGVTFEEGSLSNLAWKSLLQNTLYLILSHITKHSLFRRRLGLDPPSELAPGELQQVSLGPQLRPRQVSQLGEIREVMTRMRIGNDPDNFSSLSTFLKYCC